MDERRSGGERFDVERILEAALSSEAAPAQRIAAFEQLVEYVGQPANEGRRWEVLDTILDPAIEVAESCPQRDVVARAYRLLDTIEAMEQARQVYHATLMD